MGYCCKYLELPGFHGIAKTFNNWVCHHIIGWRVVSHSILLKRMRKLLRKVVSLDFLWKKFSSCSQLSTAINLGWEFVCIESWKPFIKIKSEFPPNLDGNVKNHFCWNYILLPVKRATGCWESITAYCLVITTHVVVLFQIGDLMRWSSQINFYSTLGVHQHFQLTEQKLPSFLHFLLLLCCRTNIGWVRHLLLLSRTKEENSTQHSPVSWETLVHILFAQKHGRGNSFLLLTLTMINCKLFLLFFLFSCKFTSQFVSLH